MIDFKNQIKTLSVHSVHELCIPCRYRLGGNSFDLVWMRQADKNRLQCSPEQTLWTIYIRQHHHWQMADKASKSDKGRNLARGWEREGNSPERTLGLYPSPITSKMHKIPVYWLENSLHLIFYFIQIGTHFSELSLSVNLPNKMLSIHQSLPS